MLIEADGKISIDKTLAQVLSEIIATETEGNTIKLYGWYKTLLEQKELILDDADLEALRKLVSENKRLFIFVKGQLLESLK